MRQLEIAEQNSREERATQKTQEICTGWKREAADLS